MATHKNKLPDSLELLLDTMCNTFGGIMFIALALIIITQVSRQLVIDTKMPVVTQGQIDKMKQEIKSLENQCSKQELANLNNSMDKHKVTSQVKDDIAAILGLRSQNEELQGKIGDMEANIENEHDQCLKAEAKIEATILRRTDLEDKAREKLSAEQLKVTKLKKGLDALVEKKKDLQRRLEELRKQATEVKPAQTITFSQEESTSLKQVDVFLCNGKLYTENTVNEYFNDEHTAVRVTPMTGRGVRCTQGDLDSVFNLYSSKFNLIALWCDYNSFNALLETRNYLRNKNFMVHWSIIPEFIFSLGSGVGKGSH